MIESSLFNSHVYETNKTTRTSQSRASDHDTDNEILDLVYSDYEQAESKASDFDSLMPKTSDSSRLNKDFLSQ